MSGPAAAEAEQLRELIREAHGAAKDLQCAIREARRESAQGALEAGQQIITEVQAISDKWGAEQTAEYQRVNGELQAEVGRVLDRLREMILPEGMTREQFTDRLIADSTRQLLGQLAPWMRNQFLDITAKAEMAERAGLVP